MATVAPASIKDLTRLNFAANPALASLLAGSIAGAIGVGVAFPLDTLKTKSQVLGGTSTSTTAAVKVEDMKCFSS